MIKIKPNNLETTKVVSVCLHGKPIKTNEGNKHRIKILNNVINKAINSSFGSFDCIIFPGGFFSLPEHIGHLSYSNRMEIINKTNFSNVCVEACCNLESKFDEKAFIIVGVDSIDKENQSYDQLCIAWDSNGIAGIGRKVFPIDKEGLSHICYSDDFSSIKRIVKLKSHKKAILCSCYDLFGVSETLHNMTARTKYIRHIYYEGQIYTYPRDSIFKTIRKECIRKWSKLINDNNIEIGLASIHRFKKPGLDLFWQRHGIASCSSFLNGGLSVGAAHFIERLPKDNRSPLASCYVPKTHMKKGTQRKANGYLPLKSFNCENSIVRLFSY